MVRSFAATLAWIGLAIERAGVADEDDVSVSLTPQQIAESLFALEHVVDRCIAGDDGPRAT
jgi:hypothetical protein